MAVKVLEKESSLITISQLPVIEEQLEYAKRIIDEKTGAAMELECSEDNRKEIKRIRAELNKERKTVNLNFRAAMETVTAPIKEVEEKFKLCVKGYEDADKRLKAKIELVEGRLKSEKEARLRDFFYEYALSKNIDFVKFEDSNIKVNLSDSMRSLLSDVKSFLNRVECDLKMIETQENREEILVEYKKSLNASNAIMDVKRRAEAIENERRRSIKNTEIKKARDEHIQKVMEKAETMPEETDDVKENIKENTKKIYQVKFTVRTSDIDKLKDLKRFLNDGGYDYE